MRLETQRTILRLFQDKDLFDLHEYASLEGIGEQAGWEHHTNLSKTRKVLKVNMNNPNMFAVELKQTKHVVGHIIINKDYDGDREHVQELGFVLHPTFHNQGIMGEVIVRILHQLFLEKTELVYACCFEDNLASKKLIEKCGFIFEKEGTYYFEEQKKTIKTLDYVYSINTWLNNITD